MLLTGKLPDYLAAEPTSVCNSTQWRIWFPSGWPPSVLIYRVAFQDLEFLGLVVTIIPALFTAIRLARFNVSADGKAHDFQGLSSPLHACLIASFVAMSYGSLGGNR